MSTNQALVCSEGRGAMPSLPKLAAIAMAIWALGVFAVPSATAQTWPQRNVRFIVPFGAGTGVDITARLLGDRLAAKWGKAVIIDNRPGGDALIGINAFISANDDHVLLYAASVSFLAHPYTQEKLPYDLERDLAPIARVTDAVIAVSVPASSPIKTVADFVNAARANPDRYNAAGAAGVLEFTVDAFLKSENLAAKRISYRDIMQASQDLAADRIQFLLTSAVVPGPMVKAGKVRIIAIAAHQRSPLFKDIPSVVEAGYPGLVAAGTAGLYGPKGMPLGLRKRISADIIATLADPVIAERISSIGQDIWPGGPEDLAATLKQQSANTAAIAKILGMEKK